MIKPEEFGNRGSEVASETLLVEIGSMGIIEGVEAFLNFQDARTCYREDIIKEVKAKVQKFADRARKPFPLMLARSTYATLSKRADYIYDRYELSRENLFVIRAFQTPVCMENHLRSMQSKGYIHPDSYDYVQKKVFLALTNLGVEADNFRKY